MPRAWATIFMLALLVVMSVVWWVGVCVVVRWVVACVTGAG